MSALMSLSMYFKCANQSDQGTWPCEERGSDLEPRAKLGSDLVSCIAIVLDNRRATIFHDADDYTARSTHPKLKSLSATRPNSDQFNNPIALPASACPHSSFLLIS